jgi:hypothetical protein
VGVIINIYKGVVIIKRFKLSYKVKQDEYFKTCRQGTLQWKGCPNWNQ